MALAFRLGLSTLLALIGVAGLVQLSLQPPLASRPGDSVSVVLADLEAQEALLDQRQQATLLLNLFVGAQITRYFWGGFSGYLEVLGIERPRDMKAELKVEDQQSAQLRLIPRTGQETYLARVEAIEGVPRGVVCRGEGTPGAFPIQADRLACPPGWRPLGSLRRLRPSP
ncbi:hypothetical protein KQ304_09650 [Synechococcus sp. CS-1329]|jgi:hypothetical protein|uniref:hypothetical protein n=1 Tax=Synechococcus sp. CS-1329 TaxID=2847975 RepID=UPI00223C1FD1|nr:hypothetical protein [Synechococcus sp. CS-1329]MCT0219259.1 hypothetical protein [Synechococcus sp. CS-1329]